MKKAKSIVAILLVFSIVFLCGCSNITAILNKNDSDYYEITAISKNASDYADIDILGDNILFLTFKGTDDYLLSIYNAASKKVTASISLENCDLEYIRAARFTGENEITLYNEADETAVAYDLALNKIGPAEYKSAYFTDEDAPKSELLSGEFIYKSHFAYNQSENTTTCIFYDEADKCYINDNDSSAFIDENNKSILKFCYADDKNEDLKLSADNYKDAVKINEIEFSKEKGISKNIQYGKLSDKYAVFVLETFNDKTGGAISVPYIWKYNDNPVNTKLDLVVRNTDELKKENAELIQNIKTKYDITVTCNEVIPGFHEDETEYDANVLEINSVLTGISKYLELFPEGFIKELYDYNEMLSGIRINIVKGIGSIDAYVADFLEEMTVVFGYRGFGQGVGLFFHEFMHLMDNRLTDYYLENYGCDFYDEWCKLNPKDFEYRGEEYGDADKKYFISDYATKNAEEDAADTLRYLCENADNEEKEDFGENVNKKIELLCKAIREAFPSAADAEELYWEKGLNK